MPVSEAQKRATAAYEKKNYDKILVRFPKGVKGRIERQSESVNAYIIQAVIERLEADEDDFLQEELDTNEEQTEPVKATRTEAKTAQISHEKEEREEIHTEPIKAGNKANKEPIDIYALQAELDARREEIKAHKDNAEAKETPELVEDIPAQQEAEESDELADRLKSMRAYRKQVVEEREKYGEASDDLIKDFVEKVEKEGEDITSPEYQERIRKAIGTVNLDRVNAYLRSTGRM